jgi:hypothetical protein
LETISNTDATRVNAGSRLLDFEGYFQPKIENAIQMVNDSSLTSISTASKTELVKQLQTMIDAGISTPSSYHNLALLELREVDGLLQTLQSIQGKYPDKEIEFVWNAVRKAAGTGVRDATERITTANLTATISTVKEVTKDKVERVGNKVLEKISRNVWSGAFGNTYKDDKVQRGIAA